MTLRMIVRIFNFFLAYEAKLFHVFNMNIVFQRQMLSTFDFSDELLVAFEASITIHISRFASFSVAFFYVLQESASTCLEYNFAFWTVVGSAWNCTDKAWFVSFFMLLDQLLCPEVFSAN